jgi:outer membrane protein OmpA-like peptidoglycan-associated protein
MKPTAKIILYFAIVMFVLSLSSVLLARGPEMEALKGVELNDGTVIHGKIIDINIYRVIIEKKDGNRVSVKFDDVYQFLKEEQPERYQRMEESASPAPIVKSEPKAAEKAIILEDVHFDFDKATLTKEEKVILKRNIQLLKDNPKAKVRIAGCTSASGTDEYNQRLSERRAEAVQEYLVHAGVITRDRLTTIGYGKTNPAVYEAAPKEIYSAAAKANMRVLFEIIVK